MEEWELSYRGLDFAIFVAVELQAGCSSRCCVPVSVRLGASSIFWGFLDGVPAFL